MKGLFSTAVALSVTEKMKFAEPALVVLLYLTVLQGSELPA
jgi:hypothetical protein